MEKQSNLSEMERAIWTEAYRFHAAFRNMENTEADWKKCCETMVQLIHKHNDHDLAKKLLLAVYDHLSEERKVNIECEETRGQSLPDTQSKSKDPCQLMLF